MPSIMDFLLHTGVRTALVLALFVNPWLLVRLARPESCNLLSLLAASGAVSVALNMLAPAALHLLRIPITGGKLAMVHSLTTLVLWPVLRARRPVKFPALRTLDWAAFALGILFALAVLPFTHLAGIDTYKWLDLATAVRVEQAIPWFVHPLSLLGFTPRSYPSAQPLVLATIQIMGGLNVEWSYWMLSAFSGALGIFAACVLGERIFGNPSMSAWFAFLYAFSPVFMRYNHWATGRGLLLSLLPLFIACLLGLFQLRAALSLVSLAVLLACSHKAGLIAVPIFCIGWIISWLLPRRGRRWLVVGLFALATGAALALTPAPSHSHVAVLFGFLENAVTRFGCYLPLAAVAVLFSTGTLLRPAFPRLLPSALVTFPMAFHREMYGALLALPFVALAATEGVTWLIARRSSTARTIKLLVIAVTALGAAAVLVKRSVNATPVPVWRAALFLENYDPEGPFRVIAPEPARSQIQGYVSGCPRFTVVAPTQLRLALKPPPVFRRPFRLLFQAWVAYLRSLIGVADASTDWYGKNPRVYYVVVRGEGIKPHGVRLLYDHAGVQIYAPADQEI